MKYFDTYTSATLASCASQSFHTPENPKAWRKGRVYCRSYVTGTYDFSLLYTNILDSTYSNGSYSHKNMVCDEWEIASLTMAIVDDVDADIQNPDVVSGSSMTFDGKTTKNVMPAEFFTTDPILLTVKEGQYFRIELVCRGRMMPHHQESIIPIYLYDGNAWTLTKELPVPSMIGCNRKVGKRVIFMGDSITQGIGTPFNSYLHYAAKCAERIGTSDISYWDIGIGFGRADDAASDGAWLFKARQADVISVCFGVNDIKQGFTEAQIKKSLLTIVETLKKAGVKVLLQTIPPFNYGSDREMWENLNRYIKEELADKADYIFDNVPILGKEDAPHMAKYGGHPDAEGCRLWAESLASVMTSLL